VFAGNLNFCTCVLLLEIFDFSNTEKTIFCCSPYNRVVYAIELSYTRFLAVIQVRVR